MAVYHCVSSREISISETVKEYGTADIVLPKERSSEVLIVIDALDYWIGDSSSGNIYPELEVIVCRYEIVCVDVEVFVNRIGSNYLFPNTVIFFFSLFCTL